MSGGNFALLCLSLFSILCNLRLGSTLRSLCKVSVESPWPRPHLLVPKDSILEINCTLDSQLIPYWTIDLANDSITSVLLFWNRREQLNAHGVYQLQSIETPGLPLTLRVLINDTASNNGTVIECVGDSNSGSDKFVVIVYEPQPASIEAIDMSMHSMNISWSHVPSIAVISSVNQTYSLTVSHGSHSKTLPLRQPHYYFTAPEGAPPCEVYNFSVTATYDIVGATYTGADCSVPSPVLSSMLPSLPNITKLESSLDYSLEINSSGGVAMRVSFMSANYCEMYPVTNYVLKVEGPTSHSDIIQSPSNSTMAVNNLLDNQAYLFSVVVSNGVGNVSTANRTIYTTDVQTITALPHKHNNSFMLQCNFLAGSNAQGCMVVLVSNFGNETNKMTRNSTHTVDIVNATHPLSCYAEVYGFDIESDGSLGSLAVPGRIIRDSALIAPCMPEELKPGPSQNISSWIIIIIGVVLGVAVVSMFVILVFIAVYCQARRFRTPKDASYRHVVRPSPTSSAGPAPATPPPAPSQDFTDGADDTKKPQPIYDLPERIIVPKEDHTYHVLETSAPRYQFKPVDFQKPGNGMISPCTHDTASPVHSESDSSPSDPPPIYQDVADIPLVRDRHNGRVGDTGQDNCPSSTESELQPSEPPVYHEIPEQPSSRASSRLHDDIPSAGTK